MGKNFIQLKKDDILRIGIKDSDGNDTGQHLEFDLEDIELPLKIEECSRKHNQNVNYLQMKLRAISKKKYNKGKGFISQKDKELIMLYKDFFKKEMEALDLFLGENGTKKILNGRKPYLTMYDDINEILEPVFPLIQTKGKDIIKKIKNKYAENKINNLDLGAEISKIMGIDNE